MDADKGKDLDDFLYLRGVNTQGGGGSQEDPARVPGMAETDYHWNSAEFYTYLRSRGHRVVRIDFLWERVQSSFGRDLDADGIAELKQAVARATGAGLLVILDMKNYGRYWLPDDRQVLLGAGIREADFADVWGQLAEAFADDQSVVGFGLMNEPWGLPGSATGGASVEYSQSAWKTFSQAAVDAIRAVGDGRAVFVSGDDWGGVWNWRSYNGAPWIEDPADNVVYEAHVYFDPDNSGQYSSTYAEAEADAIARGWPDLRSRITAEVSQFTGWLDEHGEVGFVGEIGWPNGRDAQEWNSVGELAYSLLNDAGVGATYWASGEWLSADGGLYPLDAYGAASRVPQSQVQVIEAPRFLSKEG